MLHLKPIRTVLALMACTSLVLAPMAAAHADGGNRSPAGQRSATRTPKSEVSRAKVRDVKLGDAGELTGQLVDPSGVAIRDKKIRLLQGDRVVATSVSDHDGKFKVTGLRGGTYVVDATAATSTLRLWAQGTAPPNASDGILLIASGKTLRGNLGMRGRNSGLFLPDEAGALIALPLIIGGAGIYQYQRQEESDNSPAS